MQIGRVIGTVVATQKNRKLEGAKLLLVQPLNPDDTPRGVALLAIDSVGAGVGEKVLLVIEGRAAGEALGRKAAPVDAAIIGIIDAVEYRPLEQGPLAPAPGEADGLTPAPPMPETRTHARRRASRAGA